MMVRIFIPRTCVVQVTAMAWHRVCYGFWKGLRLGLWGQPSPKWEYWAQKHRLSGYGLEIEPQTRVHIQWETNGTRSYDHRYCNWCSRRTITRHHWAGTPSFSRPKQTHLSRCPCLGSQLQPGPGLLIIPHSEVVVVHEEVRVGLPLRPNYCVNIQQVGGGERQSLPSH